MSVSLGAMLAAAPACFGQAAGQAQASAPTAQELLADFNHYVYINQIELAQASANALVERGMSPVEFVGVVEDSPQLRQRFEEAYRQAMRSPQLEAAAAKLYRMYETGRLEKARNPEEIARSIADLSGTPRGRDLARKRLISAGEYAAPQLLEVLLARSNQVLEGHVERLMIEMAGDVVAPLAEALAGVDEATQSRIALILGQIGHDTALPYLYDLMRGTDSQTVRADTGRAIAMIAGKAADTRVSVAELYWSLGERYFNESPSLTRFRGEEHQLLWTYDPGIGLYPTSVRTEVFHEARAMQMAERAMRLDARHENALALWLASNFSREIDTPEGYQNPVYPDDKRGAMYYAVLAGSGPAQQVLARALDTKDTPLARRAIEALTLTAGDAGLWSGLGARKPLLDALAYPERRVQYDAALALGRAKPTRSFAGAERVAPILAGAVRDASERFALVLASDVERAQVLSDLLMGEGYTIVQAGRSLDEMAASIAEAPGVDLVVADLSTGAGKALLEQARGRSKLQAAPLLVLLPSEGYIELFQRYEDNPLVGIRRQGIDDDQFVNAVDELVTKATGAPVSEEEAEAYALAALDTLRDLAISGNTVFNVADASMPLVAALEESAGDVRLKVAEVLSRINQKRAQVALMDAALGAANEERIALLGAVTASAKSFGNMLDPRQVRDLTALANSGSDAEATSAAALVGALNLSETQLVPLIVGG